MENREENGKHYHGIHSTNQSAATASEKMVEPQEVVESALVQTGATNIRPASTLENIYDLTHVPPQDRVLRSGAMRAIKPGMVTAALQWRAMETEREKHLLHWNSSRETKAYTPRKPVPQSCIGRTEGARRQAAQAPITIAPGLLQPSADSTVRIYVTHVISPSEFYAQQISLRVSSSASKLREQLNEFYALPQNQIVEIKDVNQAIKLQGQDLFGVCPRHADDQPGYQFERCQVLEWRKSDRNASDSTSFEVKVKLIDTGMTQWMSHRLIWEIDPRFCVTPALVVRCRLFDTYPLGGQGVGNWPSVATDRFKEMLAGDGRMFVAYVCKREQPAASLLLYSINSNRKTKQCINGQLVSEKLARTLTNWTGIHEPRKG